MSCVIKCSKSTLCRRWITFSTNTHKSALDGHIRTNKLMEYTQSTSISGNIQQSINVNINGVIALANVYSRSATFCSARGWVNNNTNIQNGVIQHSFSLYQVQHFNDKQHNLCRCYFRTITNVLEFAQIVCMHVNGPSSRAI